MTPLLLGVGVEVLHDPNRALAREWLVTNGLGGYASSSVLGANTRRYHGLLVAALQPPVRRSVLLAGLLEEITLAGATHSLSTHEFWDGTLHPRGFLALQAVEWEGTIPVFIYDLEGVRLERRVWMEQGRNATVIAYSLASGAPAAELSVAPLCVARDFHGHTHGDPSWRPRVTPVPDGIAIQMRDGLPQLYLRGFPHPQGEATGEWWWRFLHRVERERGLDAEEDLYRAGRLRFRLEPGSMVALLATVEPGAWLEDWRPGASLALLVGREAALRSAARRGPVGESALGLRLALAADQFLVRGAAYPALGPPRDGATVIAGYPWFAGWGRDTMISLNGLCLATGRTAIARAVLEHFALYLDQGMIPNYFPEDGTAPLYDTLDASLWFVLATHAYVAATEDHELVEKLLPAFEEVVRWHVEGTRHGIRLDADGLLAGGEAGLALTWMDARVAGLPVTPRIGKPVEINALWYNVLRLVARWCRQAGRPAEAYERLAAQASENFCRRFWYAEGGYCYDVVDGPKGNDPSLRPNQLLAASLPHPLLPADRARAMLAAIRRHLLTPVGLRTLAPDDPRYVGTYRGDPSTRDAAYHQGTVWPWLLGPYWEAHLKLGGDARDVAAALGVLEGRLVEAGVGTLGEIFEGDPPHRAVGCFAQAWSVGEAMRLLAINRARVGAAP